MTPATRKRLEKAAKAIEDRPAAIQQAREEGDSYRAIAKVVRMSEAGVRKINHIYKEQTP